MRSLIVLFALVAVALTGCGEIAGTAPGVVMPSPQQVVAPVVSVTETTETVAEVAPAAPPTPEANGRFTVNLTLNNSGVRVLSGEAVFSRPAKNVRFTLREEGAEDISGWEGYDCEAGCTPSQPGQVAFHMTGLSAPEPSSLTAYLYEVSGEDQATGERTSQVTKITSEGRIIQ